jgi:hypothetical protein
MLTALFQNVSVLGEAYPGYNLKNLGEIKETLMYKVISKIIG